jgi:hypothetical protein
MLADLQDGAKRNPIWFGAVAAATGVQAFFAWEFWASVSPDPTHQAALRILGLSFVAGEVVALDMASRADFANEKTRANTLRGLWAALALTTFTADINALSNVLRESDRPRLEAAARFDANLARITGLEQAIDRADDAFAHPLMSVPAYDAAIAGKERELHTARAENARIWRILALERERTGLQAERAAAQEISRLQAELNAARSAPETHQARPAADAEEFAPLAATATEIARQAQRAVGQTPNAAVSGAEVRDAMAWVATIAMKLMLTFGIWVGLQRGRGTGATPHRDDAAAQTPSPQDPMITSPSQTPASKPAPRRARAQSSAVFTRKGQRFGR